ncbi:hypothetical protein AYJ54_00865 [Bradyrhizobium centrolobii]|uniref:Uncharacterized protein n=1 Tax=Bradyrhizobium centrolobii TaxID=1505087 RepID=A0A176YH21_9BRAD|nr:hypothetical protein [Bradyrhizobium centrolobii]OAF05490.1 hypothetical protein AYJ54_00865 [Bradyrhizobium centrolobii]
MDAQEYKPMTTHELIRHLQRYQGDKSHSSSVDERWLATAIQSALDMACEVCNSKLCPESRKAVNEFRAAEIEKELDRKRRDIDALERDLKKVRAA